MQNTNLKASRKPLADIEKITYEGQDPARRMYKSGYEDYLDVMPVLEPGDKFLDAKVAMTGSIMHSLATGLSEALWPRDLEPAPGNSNRTILALEPPLAREMPLPVEPELLPRYKEGTELVMVRWGKGFASPVHGHAPGYMHEEVIFGNILVNTYRQIRKDSPIVRPVGTVVVGPGIFASVYNRPRIDAFSSDFPRPFLIHNFVATEFSATLHYLPEHTRDGRDNGFGPQYFETEYGLGHLYDNLTRITPQQGHYTKLGDVMLVRSSNVPEYGDHYIINIGPAIMKPHGLRIQDHVIQAPHTKALLDSFDDGSGLTLLKLSNSAAEAFLKFHSIRVEGKQVIIPNS